MLPVLGGDDAVPGQIPWQAYLTQTGCGASILDERHLLTAAHCVKDVRATLGTQVTVGHVHFHGKNASKYLEDECTTQIRTIVRIQPHPCYCDVKAACAHADLPVPAINATVGQYDTAVITVDQPFRFNKFVQPVCLPKADEQIPPGTMLLMSGFGHTEFDPINEIRTRPTNLQTAWLPRVGHADCAARMNGKLHAVRKEDMMCAGYLNGSQGGCSGDSGGPLVNIDSQVNRAVLIGSVSWGTETCVSYSVFANVVHVVDWIREEMRLSKMNVSGYPAEMSLTQFDNQLCYDYLVNRSLIAPTKRPTTTTSTTTTTTTTTPKTASTASFLVPSRFYVSLTSVFMLILYIMNAQK